jgi:hypothetical protein
MINKNTVLVSGIEMFFEGADESKLKSMSALWNARGSYDVESSSVTFTMSRLIPKQMDDMSAVMDMFDGTGKLQAEQAGCTYLNAQIYMYLEDEYSQALVTGQECESIIFVAAQAAYE